MKNILKYGLGKIGGKINDWRFGSYQISNGKETREVPTVRDLRLDVGEGTILNIRKTGNGYFGPAGSGKPKDMDGFGYICVTSNKLVDNIYVVSNADNPLEISPVDRVSTAASGVYSRKSGGLATIYKFNKEVVKKNSENFKDYMSIEDFNGLVDQYKPVVLATITSK